MKRYLIPALLLGLLLAGCGAAAPVGEAYDLYFTSTKGDFQSAALETERIVIPDEAEPTEALIQALLDGPTTETLSRSIPEGVSLRGWSLDNSVLTIDFSRRYGSLSGIELTLADYSVTMTLNQLPGVDSVVTTVESDRISYRDHQNLRSEDALLALHRRAPVERAVTLWVLRETEEGLAAVRQTEIITLGQDESLPLAVLNALIAEAGEDNLPGLPAQMDILSARVKDGLCSLNLSASFYEMLPEDAAQNAACLQALTLSLCELENIEAVRFLSEGEPATHYGLLPLHEEMREADVSEASPQ